MFKFFAVIFICNTYRLDIVSVSEVVCVKPYLVDKLITFLGVLVLIFSTSLLAFSCQRKDPC